MFSFLKKIPEVVPAMPEDPAPMNSTPWHLRPNRAGDLTPAQLEWCEKKIRPFKRARREAIRAARHREQVKAKLEQASPQ